MFVITFCQIYIITYNQGISHIVRRSYIFKDSDYKTSSHNLWWNSFNELLKYCISYVFLMVYSGTSICILEKQNVFYAEVLTIISSEPFINWIDWLINYQPTLFLSVSWRKNWEQLWNGLSEKDLYLLHLFRNKALL